MENEIKQLIEYCKERAIEYQKDFCKNTGGKVEYWKGKADTHRFIISRLNRILDYYDVNSAEKDIRHINELRFEGETPWTKAMNIANDYWTKYCDETLSEKERDDAYEGWMQIRYELETGKYN